MLHFVSVYMNESGGLTVENVGALKFLIARKNVNTTKYGLTDVWRLGILMKGGARPTFCWSFNT